VSRLDTASCTLSLLSLATRHRSSADQHTAMIFLQIVILGFGTS
jgi:hypothetical protein